MRTIFKIKAIAGSAFALLFGLLCVMDNLEISENPYEYSMVYHFDESSAEWRLRSIEHYKMWDLMEASICGLYIILNIFFLVRGNRYLKYILLAIEVFVFIYFIIAFYQWSASGFDH